MYMTVRHYRVPLDKVEELARRVDDDWLEKVRKMPGFVSYHVFDAEDDHIVSVTAFLDEETGKQAAEASSEWIGEHLSDIPHKFVEMRRGHVIIHGGA